MAIKIYVANTGLSVSFCSVLQMYYAHYTVHIGSTYIYIYIYTYMDIQTVWKIGYTCRPQ